MLPVEPRTATRTRSTTPGDGSVEGCDDIQGDGGRREEERIDPVEDAAVTRDQRPRILRARGALEHRLREVTGLRGQPEQGSEDERKDRRLTEPGKQQRGNDRCADQATDESGVRLGRRDVREEPGSTELPP